MNLTLVETLAELTQLEPEWSALAGSLREATPFQLPQWLLAWWSHFGSGQLRTFVFREAGVLVGIIPCFLHEWNGRSQLTLIGSGISDYLEPLILPGHAMEAVRLLVGYLAEDDSWNVIEWQDLSVDTALVHLDSDKRLTVEMREDTTCLRLPLAGTFEEYWIARSADLRRNVRRYTQRAQSEGRLEFQVIETAEPGLMDRLIQLHTERWNKLGEQGMVQANRSAWFLRDVVKAIAEKGMLRFFVLRFQDQTVAVLLTFLYQGNVFSYMSGFDSDYEEFGFGRTILFEVIRYCFASGFGAIDFLRGTERYKFSWGPKEIAKRRLVIRRCS